VVATGGQAEFGRIALGLGERQPETDFQTGLRKFSMLLVQVAGALTAAIFVINVILHRPMIDALLFSLAIAVGISPQLLPAVVSTSLAAGSRQLARRKVLVKRLVCIEDLGNVEVLFTDKTGTLTEGRLLFMRSAGPDSMAAEEPLLFGLLCNEAVTENGRAAGGNPLDVALWDSPAAVRQQRELARYRRLATLPFDHERRLVSVLVEDDQDNRMVITKGAPEGLLDRCTGVPGSARTALEAEFAAGNRVIAVATREVPGQSSLTRADEHDLRFRGLLVFLDPPKPDARAALRRLADLGITVKILTGDNPAVAAKVCADLGLPPGRVATGADIDRAGDRLGDLIAATTVFARVSPEHKAQVIRAQRRRNRRGLPRRRRQRCRRAARRRRRHLGRLGHRRGQGRRRRAAAGEEPGRAGRRRDRRPPDLRQHDQVRTDGHVQQLREHVQRRRGVAVPDLPADAAVADPAQQPAL
jgi:Mg2+-importing ATPase